MEPSTPSQPPVSSVPPVPPTPSAPQVHPKNKLPLLIALGMAFIAAGLYITSGHSSLDGEVRELSQNENVEKISTADPKKITIECKNGETYEIVFTQNQQNYDDLVFSACGPDGVK